MIKGNFTVIQSAAKNLSKTKNTFARGIAAVTPDRALAWTEYEHKARRSIVATKGNFGGARPQKNPTKRPGLSFYLGFKVAEWFLFSEKENKNSIEASLVATL